MTAYRSTNLETLLKPRRINKLIDITAGLKRHAEIDSNIFMNFSFLLPFVALE